MNLFKKIAERTTKNELYKTALSKNSNFEDVIEKSEFLNREIRITSITPQIAEEVERKIRFWNDLDEENECIINGRNPIKIYIDCYGGGSLTAMFTILDAIKVSKCPVITINIGAAYKEALYVFLAGARRYAYPRSSFLFKKDLKPFDMDDNPQSNYSNFCEKQANELKEMLLEITKITDNEYEKRETWWLDANKAQELRVCSEIVRTRSSNQF